MQSGSEHSSASTAFSEGAASVVAFTFSVSMLSTSAAGDAVPVPEVSWGTLAESSASSAGFGTNSVWPTKPGTC